MKVRLLEFSAICWFICAATFSPHRYDVADNPLILGDDLFVTTKHIGQGSYSVSYRKHFQSPSGSMFQYSGVETSSFSKGLMLPSAVVEIVLFFPPHPFLGIDWEYFFHRKNVYFSSSSGSSRTNPERGFIASMITKTFMTFAHTIIGGFLLAPVAILGIYAAVGMGIVSTASALLSAAVGAVVSAATTSFSAASRICSVMGTQMRRNLCVGLLQVMKLLQNGIVCVLRIGWNCVWCLARPVCRLNWWFAWNLCVVIVWDAAAAPLLDKLLAKFGVELNLDEPFGVLWACRCCGMSWAWRSICLVAWAVWRCNLLDLCRAKVEGAAAYFGFASSEEPVSPKRRRHRRCCKRRRGNGHRQARKCHIWRRFGHHPEVEGPASPPSETGSARGACARVAEPPRSLPLPGRRRARRHPSRRGACRRRAAATAPTVKRKLRGRQIKVEMKEGGGRPSRMQPIHFCGRGGITANDIIIKLINLGHVPADVAWSRYGLFRSELVTGDSKLHGGGHGRYDRYELVDADTVYFLMTTRGMNGGTKETSASSRKERSANQKAADDINAETERTFGYLPTIQSNSKPSFRSGKRKLVTPRMLNQACALELLFFTARFMYVQFYCAWWWFKEKAGLPKITDECDHLVPYGWGVRSALRFQDGSGGKSGNMLSYFRAFSWMGEFGVMNQLDKEMPMKGRDAIAAALDCDVEELPEMLQLPLIPEMFAVAFVGILCYLPTLWVICCCGGRCKMVCDFLGYDEDEKGIIISDKIWVSKPVYEQTYFHYVPEAAFDWSEDVDPKYLHTWYMPVYHMDGKFLAIQFHHTKKRLGRTKDVTKLHAWLAGEALAGRLPIKGDMINLKLATFATHSSYDVAAGEACGTSTCRGGVICVRKAQEDAGLLDMENGREVLLEPDDDLFWTEPRTRGGEGSGMKDARIKELVVEWMQFHEWRAGFLSERLANLRLFLIVLSDGIFSNEMEEGKVLEPLLKDRGGGRFGISPKIVEHIVDAPWKAIDESSLPKPGVDDFEEPSNYEVGRLALRRDYVWDWWMKRPADGSACRADKFKWWHWIGNKHKVSASKMASDATITISKMAADANDNDHRAFDEDAQRAFNEGDGAITIFNGEDDDGDIEQQGDDEAVPDVAAPSAGLEAAAAHLASRFPEFHLTSEDDGWSTKGPCVGDVIVRLLKNNRKSLVARPTFALVVAYLSPDVKNPYLDEREKPVPLYRVLYGDGPFAGEDDDLEDWELRNARPRTPEEAAMASALSAALAARRAAPPSSRTRRPAEHPKLAELRKYIADRHGDPSGADGWTIDETRPAKPYRQPGTGFRYSKKEAANKIGVGAQSQRKGPKRERTEPRAWDTDLRRLPSCIERMGLKCVCCGYVAADLEDLTRHRMTDCEYEDPIGPVQAPWLPPRNVLPVGDKCFRCQYNLAPPHGTWMPEPGRRKSPLQPGAVFTNCDNANAGRCHDFRVQQAINKRRLAQHYEEIGARPRATAPSKKRPKP